jgi:hypothetical protein
MISRSSGIKKTQVFFDPSQIVFSIVHLADHSYLVMTWEVNGNPINNWPTIPNVKGRNDI